MHSVTWQGFTDHLLYAKYSARLWGCSCESDKIFVSQSCPSGEEKRSPAQHVNRCPPQPKTKDTSRGSQEKEPKLGRQRGRNLFQAEKIESELRAWFYPFLVIYLQVGVSPYRAAVGTKRSHC